MDNQSETNEVILNLEKDVRRTVDAVNNSNDHALFVLGAFLNDRDISEDHAPEIQTFIASAGFNSILAEALYAELNDQIQNGNISLFSVFRDVIRDLEEENGISPDEDLEENNEKPTLH